MNNRKIIKGYKT